MLPRQALGKVMEKQEHRDPPCLSQSVWPGGPSNLPLFHCRLPKLLRGRWPPSIGASADPGQDWSWAGISGAYSQGSHGRVAKARPATCCEGWFNKTTLSPTVLACLASVNKITGFSWQFSLVLFALCLLLPWKVATLALLGTDRRLHRNKDFLRASLSVSSTYKEISALVVHTAEAGVLELVGTC